MAYRYDSIPEPGKIIESWFYKANSNGEPFDNFIALWISFNGFYTSSKRYNQARKLTTQKNIPEYLYLESFCSEKKYQNIYFDLLKNTKSFEDYLNYFLKLLEKTRFKGKIADLRPDMRNDESAAKPFSNINNFEQFISISYQIRCNLFHGNKSSSDDGDKDIVNAILEPFKQFLEKVYENEGYLNIY